MESGTVSFLQAWPRPITSSQSRGLRNVWPGPIDSLSLLKSHVYIFVKPTELIICFFFFVLVFLGPHPQHMEVPRPGVQLEL